MAVFKCKMCGAALERQNDETVLACDYCGTTQTLPKTSDDNIANLFNRATNLRLKCEFDKAAQVYEKIVEQDDGEAEAHWGIVLCKYGIEYVEDPATNKRIPTCHRTRFEAITTDADYQAAIDYSDFAQQEVYQAEARAIDKIQKDILAVVRNEKPFDVFICYKETDASGSRTRDSVIANDIYYQLTSEGYKVFYAAITLEDKLGQEYEPYIFAALNSAKVMLAVGTQPEYFSAVWVKNEWSRFLQLMKNDRSKLLIPCYRDMDAYDLPEEFSHLQAQDMGKIGFINDLVRGIQKVIKKDEPKPKIETIVQTVSAPNVAAKSNDVTVESLLKRAFIFLGDSEWQSADEYCERVLDIDPENAQAYLGKLMVERHIRRIELLSDQQSPYDSNNYYQKAVKYADASFKQKITEANDAIKERNRIAELERIYRSASEKMQRAEEVLKGTTSRSRDFMRNTIPEAISLFNDARNYKNSSACIEQCKDILYQYAVARKDGANSIDTYWDAKKDFMAITGYNNYKDCNALIQACDNAIAEAKKEEVYRLALRDGQNATSSGEYRSVITTLNSIRDYKDVNAQLKRYQRLYDEKLAAEKEAERLEAERKVQERRKLEQAEKRRKTIITVLVIAGVVALLIGLYKFASLPNDKLFNICCVVSVIIGVIIGIAVAANGGGFGGFCIGALIAYFICAIVLILLVSGLQFITGHTPTVIGSL